ncbi:hypothetical protein ACFSTE_13390 [Aquimarina hainanensis]|uniref:Uncharacterized protein n=1 Tax=Aquimarina hainanensis TaxID=1578017 RepID=A0ABW5NBM0_9FLAO|nr:hypothetical protein [Aquimarina sp. TRL1]QKX04205.1 hypothetical protein HN014_04535 [Aquimarina sp. TRL1]
MSGLSKYSNYRVPASSLLESVIAITIIATCLLIAIRLYVQVLNSSPSAVELKMRLAVDKAYIELQETQDWEEGMITQPSFRIAKRILPYGETGVRQVVFTVLKDQDTVQVYNYLIEMDDEQL